jgi:hypothetical protein
MKEVADTERFREFADAHRKTVYIKMLARMRRQCGDPNWAPFVEARYRAPKSRIAFSRRVSG